jgi:hypothetical protein
MQEAVSLSFGKSCGASTRPLPSALPVGARHDVLRPQDHPNTQTMWILKTSCPARPQEALSTGCRSDRPGPRHPIDRCEESAVATPSPVPGTGSLAQAWTIDSSHRVPGTDTRDRRGQRSFNAPTPRGAPRGCHLLHYSGELAFTDDCPRPEQGKECHAVRTRSGHAAPYLNDGERDLEAERRA